MEVGITLSQRDEEVFSAAFTFALLGRSGSERRLRFPNGSRNKPNPERRLRERLQDRMCSLGFLETVTPNFSHFLVRRDGGDWQKEQGPLNWKLAAGENQLEVRAVNAFGRSGRVSSLRVFLGDES